MATKQELYTELDTLVTLKSSALKNFREIDQKIVDQKNAKYNQVFLGEEGYTKEKCLKLVAISPSNIDWYSSDGDIYVVSKPEIMIYLSKIKVAAALAHGLPTEQERFTALASLGLAAKVAFAAFGDNEFAQGLKTQYAISLKETIASKKSQLRLANAQVY